MQEFGPENMYADLTPLRLDKQATDEYFNHYLSAANEQAIY